jgi:hypothetical protein
MMSVFIYFGVELDLVWLLSYGRVSTPGQTEEEGGSGISRQRQSFEEFCAWCGVPEDTSLGSLVDEGKSGRGKHLERGAALRRLMDEIRAGNIKPKTGLVVESFSRLWRLETDDGMHLFTEIIRSDTALISLTNQFAITRASLRKDQGVIHRVASAIQSARAESDSKVYYNTVNFRGRRGTASNVMPSWIIKTADGKPVKSVIGLKKAGAKLDKALDEEKQAQLEYVFRSALENGLSRLASKLNAEAMPVLNAHKRKRGVAMWSTGTLAKLLRGKQVLGLQPVGHYENGKRIVHKGEYVEAYPAAIRQELWDAVQVKMDARKTGRDPASGRNVTKMTNIFGQLIRCECGLPMRVHRRGQRGQYVYLACSALYDGGCKLNNKRWYRLDHIERTILPRIAAEVVDDTPPPETQAAKLEKQLVVMQAGLSKTEASYEASMRREGAMAEKLQTKLEAEHRENSEAIKKLERQIAALHTAKPVGDLQERMRSVLDRGLEGDVAARAIIADALPRLVHQVILGLDGNYTYRRGRLTAHAKGWKAGPMKLPLG